MTALVDWLRNEGRARNRHKGDNAPKHKCEQAADALESMMREKDAMGWQPIETAPRDGTHILAAIAGETFGYQQPVLATVVHWFNDPEEPGFYTSVNERAPERTFEATHWMPLPAPPRAALDMTLDKKDTGNASGEEGA